MSNAELLDVIYWNPFKRFIKKEKNKGLKREMKKAVEEIRKNPMAGEMKSGDLAGIYCLDVIYDKVIYEIAYTVEEDRKGSYVIIIMAGTRENFYQELKKYLYQK